MVGIYKITNLINKKVYIGQSIDINQRFNEHKSYAFCEKRECYNYPLYRAMRKYGLENFEFSILEICSEDKKILNEKEQKWILYYDSLNKEKGYNLILSNLDANHTAIKINQYDLNGNFIISYNSMREAERCTGVHHTAISRCCNEKKGDTKAGNYQWCYSSTSLEGHKYKGPLRKIAQYDINNNLIAEYNSIKEAAINMGVAPQSISSALRKGYKSCGYIWRYID